MLRFLVFYVFLLWTNRTARSRLLQLRVLFVQSAPFFRSPLANEMFSIERRISYIIKNFVFSEDMCLLTPQNFVLRGPQRKNSYDVRKCTRSGRADANARTSKPIENRVFSIERASANGVPENACIFGGYAASVSCFLCLFAMNKQNLSQ